MRTTSMLRSGTLGFFVVLLTMPGLLMVTPVSADPVPRVDAPARGVPPLSLPEVTAAPLAGSLPAGDGTLSVPENASAPLRSKDTLPEPDFELVGKRDAVTEVWENTDGTETITIHGEPIHYQPVGSTAWQDIDNTLVPVAGRAGWLQNAANDWTVRFGPLRPGGAGGVEVVTDAGPVRFAAELARGQVPIDPVVGSGADADTVTYPGVWPGVDVVYTVSGARVKEDIVVHDWTRSEFPFVTEGLGLIDAPARGRTPAVEVTGAQAAELAIGSVEVINSKLRLAGGEAAPKLGVGTPAASDGVANTAVPGAPQRLTVSVDREWLAGEVAGAGSVVIDPTLVVLDGFWHTAFKSDGFQCTGCGVKVGNSQGGAGGAPTHWRTAGGFAYWSSIAGKQLLYAGVWMSRDTNTQSSAAQPVSIYWATGSSYAGAIAGGDASRRLGTQTMGDSGAFDVTSTVGLWQYFGLQNEAFGFSGAETTCTQQTTACYTYRSSSAALVLNVNTAPPAPALVAPNNDSLAITSLTPTLKWNTVTDPDGDPVEYTAMIATGLNGESGMVATGPESTATTWQVPAGVLRDGVTYYWKVYANDGNKWTPSAIRRLTVTRAGIAPPVDDFAGVSTNLITGNASITVAGPRTPTMGGGIGVDLSYESLATVDGLVGEYRVDEDQDHQIDTSEDLVLVRTDPQVSFDWSAPVGSPTGLESVSPSPGVPSEHFTARWTGSITLPARASGDWQVGARSDDGVRVWIDDTLVLDRWQTRAMPASPDYQTGATADGMVHKIRIEYFQGTGGSGVELWMRPEAATPNPADAFVVPAGWLSAQPQVLPSGWRLDTNLTMEYIRAEVSDGSVVLVRSDGTPLSFPKTAYGLGHVPPKGVADVVVVNIDGTVTVHAESGRTYLFRADGGLDSVTSAAEDQASAATDASYDATGRVTALTDPVSGQSVTLTYAPSANCEEDPPVLGGGDFDPAPVGFLCRITYWDQTSTQLYYNNGLLGYVRNPGNAFWGYSYNTAGVLTGYHDPLAFDAAMSGARTDWDELLVEITYDGTGRASTVTQQPPLQGAARPAVTYGYAPATNANGQLTGGTATVTRAGVGGTHRTVAYDGRGRGTTETDATGAATTTAWNADDQNIRTDEPGGVRSTTLFDQASMPTDSYGPAPAAQFNPDGTGQAGVAHEETNYDEGMDGLAVKWWNNANLTGTPVLHQHDPGSLDSNWGAGSPAAGTVNADNFSGRYTGRLVFPTAGTYALRFDRDNRLAFYLDDTIRLAEWGNTAAGISGEATFTTAAANESHRVRVDFAETTGSARLKLQWKTPGSATWVTVPATALRTGYGLTTSTVGVDGVRAVRTYTDAASGLAVEHAIPTSASTDPAGLNLTEATRRETAGAGRFRRPLVDTMPSGAQRTLRYYGNAETRDNPCTAAVDTANQAGRLKLTAAPDPDGTGSATPVVREAVYDILGRPVASRAGTDPWTCVSYDGRGRVTRADFPAYGGAPARTVTSEYQADPDGSGPRPANPLVNTVTDTIGTIMVENDLAGRPVSQTDVFGNTTTFGYDQAGRQISSTGPVGTIESTYDNADRLTVLKRNGQVLATGLAYDTAGRLTGVAFPSGAGNAGNGTSGVIGYDTRGHPASVVWSGQGGTTITSDSVTRDAAGRIIGQVVDGVDHHAGNDFVYDAAGRLTKAWVPGAAYSYDFFQNGFCVAPDSYKNGDRTGMTVTPTNGTPVQTHYCYDHADRLTGATDATVGTVAYDSHGNTTTIFGETHTYDVTDRHLSTTKAATTVSYVRDALDRIVARKVNGAVVARYGYTGSSDAASFVTDGAGGVLAVTYSLPCGVLLTTAAGNANVWSYPNLHGDYVATTNQQGAKQGTTTSYDPYGNLVTGTLPDNSPDDYDYAWLGSPQRPLEHEPTLQPVIEMGARQYSPLLGRFLEVDPLERGSCNDYDYVCGDPVGGLDLAGSKHHVYFRYGSFFGVITGITLYVSRDATKLIDAWFNNWWATAGGVITVICLKVGAITSGPLAPITAGACGAALGLTGLAIKTWIKFAANRRACATIKWGIRTLLRPVPWYSNGTNCYSHGTRYLWRKAA